MIEKVVWGFFVCKIYQSCCILKLLDSKAISHTVCENYEFIFEKYGPVIKHLKEDGEIEYIQGNKQLSIDIDKLKDGKYSLEELKDPGDICLGKYEDHDIFIKHGRYGYYAEWNDKRESIFKSFNADDQFFTQLKP